MSAHRRVCLASRRLRGDANHSGPRISAVLILFASIALAGCKTTAQQNALRAADASEPVKPATYRNVTAGYDAQRPAEVKPWRERNNAVAPQEKN
jgi:hypothetical protein